MARMRRVLSVTLIVIQLAAHSAPRSVQAAGVVGNGTAASCTESALAAALAGGGAIRFNCGPAPITIPITRTAEIAAPTEIDGGGRVTLDAGGRTRIFYLNKWEKHNGLRVTLRNITLANGRSGGTDPQHGGCIYSRRSVIELEHVIFAGCQAQVAGGGPFVIRRRGQSGVVPPNVAAAFTPKSIAPGGQSTLQLDIRNPKCIH
jgi:hypothetical protein